MLIFDCVVFYRVSTALGYRADRYNGDILESYPLNIDNGKYKSTHIHIPVNKVNKSSISGDHAYQLMKSNIHFVSNR